MARKPKKMKEIYNGDGPPERSRAETRALETGSLETQVGGNNQGPGATQIIDSAEIGRQIAEVLKLSLQFGNNGPSGAAAPTMVGNPSPQFGQNALGMASGFGSHPAPPPPPAAIASGTAASTYIARQAAGQNAPGLAGAIGMGPGSAASGVNFAARAVGDFADNVGRKIGASGLEVSARQVARENLDPGRFVESALGTAASAGVPGAAGLQGFVSKLNADSDARSGRSALQQARGRLADIAGGLAQRGASFTDAQLGHARDVLHERAQREINVRMQIRNLEDGTGAQRSGLGSGGHAR